METNKVDTTFNYLISILNDNPSSFLVVKHWKKVNYNLLTSEDGLKEKNTRGFGRIINYLWKPNNKRGNKKKYRKYLRKNRKVVDDFLKTDKLIPNSTYSEIQNYLDSILDSTIQNNNKKEKEILISTRKGRRKKKKK